MDSNNVDAFILRQLEGEGLSPNGKADRYTLIRRLSLDLIGLPPSVEEIETFVNDQNPNAYEQLVDRLLTSPHFGERWAAMWLDLARYADSKGYEKDRHREIWMYRDWVIKAFNEDKPFDKFIIEQLAGDLLPHPTPDQYIATGFHRNTMNNSEGGVQNEEYRMAAVIDRVNTTWEVINGTSFGCAQCHGHPYDPFTQEEYYQFFDFFNNTRDEDISDESPNLKFYDELAEAEIEQLKTWIQATPSYEESNVNWDEEIDRLLRITEPKVWSYQAKVIIKTATVGDDYLLEGRHGGIALLDSFPLNGRTKFLFKGSSSAKDSKIIVHLDEIDGPIIGEWNLGTPGSKTEIFDLEETTGFRDIYLHFESSSALNRPNDRVGTFFWIIPSESLTVFDQPGGTKYKKQFLKLLQSKGKTSPILFENPRDFRRKTFVLDRGSWLSPKTEVSAGVPESMPDFESYEKNRLGLAQWLVNGQHPLTSRVIVNRLWEQLFGTGIVMTLEDFGTQGELPSHPDLLDYLAERFENEHQWSIKSFLREIVSSATYQQSSKSSDLKLEKDPYNRLLSMGPRFRLSAEQIRDQTLAVSGLLSPKMYGRSVMPHLPASAWNLVYPQYNDVHWKLSDGEDRYRRGIYTYWKRSSPYPAKITFDVQSRTVCASRRIRTNTPLQALVMLNDPVYLEAANALGALMAKYSSDATAGIAYGYQKALSKNADLETLELLNELYEDALKKYDQGEAFGGVENDEAYTEIGLNGPMAVVANAILNLDAFVMKE